MELAKILLIDTSRLCGKLIEQKFPSMEVFYTDNLDDGIEIAGDKKVDLIVLSAYSLEKTGFEIARSIRETEEIQFILLLKTF